MKTSTCVAVVALLVAACDEPSPTAPPNPPAGAPVPTAPPPDPVRDAVAFVQAIEPLMTRSSRLCYAAKQCGSLDVVGTPAGIQPCLTQRLTQCMDAQAEFEKAKPPPELAADWPAVVRNRGGGNSLAHARLTDDLLRMLRAPPPAVYRGEAWTDIDDWVARSHHEMSGPYNVLYATEAADREASLRVDAWFDAHHVCPPGVHCTLGKAASGVMVETRYLRP